MAGLSEVDIARVVPGGRTDRLVAEYVLGWQEWTPQSTEATLNFVINSMTGQLERCLAMTATACYGTDYPESAGEYRFSTDECAAALVYRMLPVHLQTWRLTPLEICKVALRWKQEQAR